MNDLTCYCMAATTFDKNGGVDEDAQRRFLQLSIDNKLGVYVGSGGNGEGHALLPEELRRLYEISVSACKGKVAIEANLPEQYTARASIEHAQIAIAAGIEVIHIYQLEGRHGMKPTDTEFVGYFDDILSVIHHPVALAINPTMGYTPKATAVAEICRKYPQVVMLRLSRVADTYIISLKDMIDRPIAFCNQFSTGAYHPLSLGSTGVFSPEANILPKSFARFAAEYKAGDLAALSEVYAEIRRFSHYVTQWGPSSARWIKMCMKVLRIPGGEGGLRRPYQMPSDEEMAKFTAGLIRLRVPEIHQLAKAAGLSPAA